MLFNGSQAYIWTKTEIMIGCNVENMRSRTTHARMHARRQTDGQMDGRTDRRQIEIQRHRDRETETQRRRATEPHTDTQCIL